MTAVIAKRSGKYRAQLLIHAINKGKLQQFLTHSMAKINTIKVASTVRWSLDVDPLEMV